jgi:hypothetical protein
MRHLYIRNEQTVVDPLNRSACSGCSGSFWPSRRKQGKIYGKQESCKEVIDVEILFYLKKQNLSRYVPLRIARGVAALPLHGWRMDGVLGAVNPLLSRDLRLTENFPSRAWARWWHGARSAAICR